MLALVLAFSLTGGVGVIDGVAQAAPIRHAAAPHRLHRNDLMQENRRLQQRVDSAYAAAVSLFADELLGANIQDNPIHAARSEWQARIARCANQSCRHALLMDELRRLRFPFQTSRLSISQIPWRTGAFRIEYREGGGGLQILPIIDDLILIRADTVERHADWMCDLIAYGRVRANGTADMKVVGDDVRFTLTAGRRGEIILRPIGPEPNGHAGCPVRGSLWGAYRPHYGP